MRSSDRQSAKSLPGGSGLSLAARFSGKHPLGQNKTRCICARNSHSLEKNTPTPDSLIDLSHFMAST
jgi:hypothetical protein